jgi:hypothetical protein
VLRLALYGLREFTTLAPPQHRLDFLTEPRVYGLLRLTLGGCAPIHCVSRLNHFSTRTGRYSSSAWSRSAGDSPASTSARFSGFRAWAFRHPRSPDLDLAEARARPHRVL